jgi:hypothetical protein
LSLVVEGSDPTKWKEWSADTLPGGLLKWVEVRTDIAANSRGRLLTRILWGPERPELHVICPGKWCDAAGERGVRGLPLWMSATDGKATRLGVATDDYRMAGCTTE